MLFTQTLHQETLESVKKCKNFLVTLIKLASSDPRSANMANNVRGLVRSLLVRPSSVSLDNTKTTYIFTP